METAAPVTQGIPINIGLNDTARVGRGDGRHQLGPETFLFGLQQLLPQATALAPVLLLELAPVGEGEGSGHRREG